MGAMNNVYLAQFEESLEGWTDHRMITSTQIRDLAMFTLYLVNLAEADGWQYDGHSFKMGVPLGCLVVKATLEGVPHVVFTSGRTPMGCVTIFMRKLEGGLLEWVPDRYRT